MALTGEVKIKKYSYFRLTIFRPSPPSPSLISKIDSSVACLWLLTPLSAGTAVVAVLIAVTTNNWLHTEENMLYTPFNGTGKHELVAKHTVSGLWRICHTDRKLFSGTFYQMNVGMEDKSAISFHFDSDYEGCKTV